MQLVDEFDALIRDLEVAGVEYAVAGALALAIWGVPRATTDIDLLVRPEGVDAALGVARQLGFRIEAGPMRFGDGMEVRRVTKVSGEDALTLDLLLVHEALEPVWASRLCLDGQHGALWVVSREGLIQMKATAARPQDLADIRRLEEADR
jgi:hypothetical protein